MKTEGGDSIPVDPDGIDEAELEWAGDSPLYDPDAGHVSHFRTCTDPNRYSRSRAPNSSDGGRHKWKGR